MLLREWYLSECPKMKEAIAGKKYLDSILGVTRPYTIYLTHGTIFLRKNGK